MALVQQSYQESAEQRSQLRDEVSKYREIKKIIREEQKNEQQKNLQVFVNLNYEEKILRKELADRQHELE